MHESTQIIIPKVVIQILAAKVMEYQKEKEGGKTIAEAVGGNRG